MSDLYQHADTQTSFGPMVECDLCDQMYHASALLSLGTMRIFDGETEVFICETCAEKAARALARKRAVNAQD